MSRVHRDRVHVYSGNPVSIGEIVEAVYLRPISHFAGMVDYNYEGESLHGFYHILSGETRIFLGLRKKRGGKQS